MATAYTPILQLALPVTGELQGTWGTVVNDNITSMIEQAIAGLATINTWTTASHTLTTANGTTSEARCAVLECSGAPGAAATVICPTKTKLYVIKNSVTGGYAVTLKTSAGTGISVPNGSTALLYCDGTNVVSGATYMAIVSTTQVDILAQGDLRLQDSTGGEYVALQSPATLAASYTLTLPVDDGTAGQALVTDGNGVLSWSSSAFGDVYGPASATDNAVARFDLTTGKLIQNSVVTIADTTGNMTGVGTLGVGAITTSGALTYGGVTLNNAVTGTGNMVLSTSPTLVTPALGTPASGVVTNLTGTASININGTVGATTPAAGAFTTLTTSSNAVISDNSANAALRITQIGAGNAILVEDSANPDSTPFVVDASGRVVIGNTAGIASYGANNVSLQEHGLINTTSSAGLFNWGSSGTSQAGLLFAKSKSNVIGTRGIVSSGDQLGEINFAGDDGVAFIPSASIRSLVNGTPGVNDMPGALIFSTTADGAATVAERMRINASGEALIGTTSAPGVNLSVSKNITGGTSATGVLSNGQLQTDVTSSAQYFNATPSQIINGALSQLRLFAATQGTFSGRVGTQVGFFANSLLVGATNNYGFYSDIATTPFGGTATSTVNVVNSSGTTVTVGTVATHGLSNGQVVTVTLNANAAALISGVLCTILTVGTTDFTLIGAASNTVGVSFVATGTGTGTGTVTLNQQGSGKTITVIDTFTFSYTATSATFTNIVATGTVTPSTRFNFYANGTADNYFAGKIGIGTEPYGNTQILINGTVLNPASNGNVYTILNTTASDTNTSGSFYGSLSQLSTSVTGLANLYYYSANQGTFNGAVTNQYGFYVSNNLTGATNNYAFNANLASATGRFNFYAGGTAANVFVGTTSIGGIVGSESLRVVPTASAVNYLQIAGSASTTPTLSAQGSGTNLDIVLTPKGTGVLQFGTLTANADAPITGYITIKDSGGTTRKLAVIA